MRFSSDGKQMLTASRDRTAAIWNVETGELIRSFPQDQPLLSCAFSPDDKRIITSDVGRMAHVWDATTGTRLFSTLPHPGGVWYCLFSPDGRTLYALKEVRGKHVFAPTHVAAFDWPSMQARPSITLPAERDPLRFVIAPNNRDIYMIAEDAGNAKIYRGKSSGGEAKLAFDMSAGVYSNLVSADRAGNLMLIANFDSAASPPEVVRIDPTRGQSGLAAYT